MIFQQSILLAAIGSIASAATANSCTSISTLQCQKTATPPSLDTSGDTWSAIETVETPLTAALTSQLYTPGNVKIQCVYDDEQVYFRFQVPGKYSFDSTNDEKCAAMSEMFQIGEKAELYNMGNCPMGMGSCSGLADCSEYLVDVSPHFELASTERAVIYEPNTGTGDDAIANKDDEYAVSPYCRNDDDGSNAGNEWYGAWNFATAVAQQRVVSDGEDGYYIFEVSRSLTTPSPETDVQLVPGKAVGWGFAFWDPFETDNGWTDSGHYVTGCSQDWIDLILVTDEPTTLPANETSTAITDEASPATTDETLGANGKTSSAENSFVHASMYVVSAFMLNILL
ncbi:hypothetical protein ACHAXM_009928 [Skeletonema potamos]